MPGGMRDGGGNPATYSILLSIKGAIMKLFLSILGLAIVLIIVILAYYGLFAKVTIAEKEAGDFWIVYEKHIGDYKEVGKVMDKIYSRLLGEDAVETTRGFGLYYDNPKKVQKENLRSIVGCILENKDAGKIEYLRQRYKIKKYPSSKSVVVEFTYRGTLSIFIGIFKVYPKIAEYMEQHNYAMVPVMEIYDSPNQTISYVVSVDIEAKAYDDFLK